jgi:arginine/lysine/ornithine decarboxylase
MADEYKTLFARLKEYSGENPVPMHMPGHKRNVPGIAFLEQLGAKYDITEIQGFDDLHAPQGILYEAMARAAETWGSDRCFFLVNGSTGGVLAAVRAVSKPGGKLIMARNSHKSVYNAAELCALEPVYLRAPPVDGFGFCGSIPVKEVEIAVRGNPGTPVILTSPTYEGVISNISEIAVICHLYGSPLIVDEAHGSHLDLSGAFTGGAVRAGADVVIQSLHKTLTGLTQTGLLHVSGGLVSPESVAAQLAVFESSSPSYLLMASIDGTAELIRQHGNELFRAWEKRLDDFDRRIKELMTLRIPGHGEYFDCQYSCRMPGFARQGISGEKVYDYDRSKIIISCEGTDTTGVALMERLRNEYEIECEMAAGGYVVAMTGLGDTDEALDSLADAIIELDGQTCRTAPRVPYSPPGIPPRSLSIKTARQKKTESLFLRDAKGRIAAEYVWAYPPGIPLVVPGEELTGELLTSFFIQREAGVKLRSTSGAMPMRIAVVKES